MIRRYSLRLLVPVMMAVAIFAESFALAPKVSAAGPQTLLPVYFAAGCEGTSFLGFPTWYKYLHGTRYETIDTNPASLSPCKYDFSPDGGSTSVNDASALVLIALGIADMMLRLIGVVAVGFVIFGGIKFVISQGEPEKTKGALATIRNAFIGVVIAIIASGVVAYVGQQLGP